MRPATGRYLAPAVTAALLLGGASPAWACPKSVEFTAPGAKPRTAEYLEILPRRKNGKLREKSVGERVEGDTLTVMETYYVPRGASLSFTSGGIRYSFGGGSYFIPYCTSGPRVHVRLMEGSVSATGRAAARAAARVRTIEAVAYPYPGRPDFRVRRRGGRTAATTSTTVSVPDPDAARMFVQASGVPGLGNVPCQAGGRVTITATGRVSRAS